MTGLLIRERARGANRKFFVSLCEPRTDTPKSVMVADGKRSVVKGVGSCVIWCLGGAKDEKQISLIGMLFIPELGCESCVGLQARAFYF